VHLLVEQSGKFHTDPIWNDGALGFLKTVTPTRRRRRRRKSSTMGSLPDPKATF